MWQMALGGCVAQFGRRTGSPWGAHGTVVEEEGEPQPSTVCTHRGGTVLGAFCSLTVQATAVTCIVPWVLQKGHAPDNSVILPIVILAGPPSKSF